MSRSKAEEVTTTIPPLRFAALTPFYDATVALLTRERAWRVRMLEMLATRPGERLLDVGCGTGSFLKLLEGRDLVLAGVDAEAAALAIARGKLGYDVQLLQANALALPCDPGSLDVITSSLFFHHLLPKDKLLCLQEIHRALRPGGRLLIGDWGKPLGPVSRAAFFSVQWLDGFATTRDSVTGALPKMIEACGFAELHEGTPLLTPTGVVRFWTAVKRAAGVPNEVGPLASSA